MNLFGELSARFSSQVANYLREAGQLAARRGQYCYIVGGLVRDLLLGWENTDIDLVVSGGGITFAEEIAAHWGGRVVVFGDFDTAKVLLPNGWSIDVAGSRKEYYPRPGALPRVSAADLWEDLWRRDFTINALALSLGPEDLGKVVDPFDGLGDLRRGLIRVLHDQSFHDDPTRLYRAVRFGVRYGFQLEERTRDLMALAVEQGLVRRLSSQRLGAEIRKILAEKQALSMIQMLMEFGLLGAIHRALAEIDWALLWGIAPALRALDLPCHGFAYLAGILFHQSLDPAMEAAERLALSGAERRKLRNLLANWRFALWCLHWPQVRPSTIHDVLSTLPEEGLALLWAHSGAPSIKERLIAYHHRLSKVELLIGGNDLTALGYHPGPSFGKVLRRVLQAKLDGEVATWEDELSLADRLMGQMTKEDA
ncbi:MAG: CCA tRNA nucleotidyltransferase [Firmicutes bacterium]|nr:CCA tRNA nucleotidyltransferase [Bacillota bacterium]